VVDAVRPLPVVAAGGIFDGRGLASALMLGAAGVNVGTRFLASREAPVAVAYKDVIAGAASQDAVRFSAFNRILPEIVAGGYDVALRTIRTAFVEEWEARPGDVERERQTLLQQVMQANAAGRIQELMVPAGQSAGGISGTIPAADIVADMIRDAEDTLRGTAGWLR
jgi:nitronate monooxygenase/enoyl-[acyl-carrier protein] reductase II